MINRISNSLLWQNKDIILYLQVHFMSDVIAGFTSGSIWVLLCVAIYQQQKRLAK